MRYYNRHPIARLYFRVRYPRPIVIVFSAICQVSAFAHDESLTARVGRLILYVSGDTNRARYYSLKRSNTECIECICNGDRRSWSDLSREFFRLEYIIA